MYVPRDIVDVCEQIIQAIPVDQIKLKKELEDYIGSLWNKAPEVKRGSETFIPVANILISNIPKILELTSEDPKWNFDVRNIFKGKPILAEEYETMSKKEQENLDSFEKEFIEKEFIKKEFIEKEFIEKEFLLNK